MEDNFQIINAKKRGNILTALFVLMPILNVYGTGISGLGMGDILCVPLMMYIFFFCPKNKTSGINNTLILLVLYYLYAVVISLTNLLLNDYAVRDVFIRLLVNLFYIVVIFAFTSKKVINADYAYKFYLRVSLIISCIVFIQALMFYLFDKNVYFLIPFLKYNQSTLANYETYVSTYNNMYLYQFRPTAVFLEPSHLALYISPCVFFILNKKQHTKKDFIYAFLITGAVLFSTSGTGYLLVFVVWIAYLFRIITSNEIKPQMLAFIMFFAVAVIIFVCTSDYIPVLISRLQSIGDGSASSINVRLLKGFHFAQHLNPFEKLFGIGCGTYDSYINTHSIIGEEFLYEYMNSVSEVIVSVGILGFLIFTAYLLLLRRYFKKANYQLMFYFIFLMYLTGSVSFSWYDCLPIVMTVALTDNHLLKVKRDT